MSQMMNAKLPTKAEVAAEDALRALGKEELLFVHHGDVYVRPDAYARLATFFEAYAAKEIKAARRSAQVSSPESTENE